MLSLCQFMQKKKDAFFRLILFLCNFHKIIARQKQQTKKLLKKQTSNWYSQDMQSLMYAYMFIYIYVYVDCDRQKQLLSPLQHSAAVPTAEICNLPSLSTFRLSTAVLHLHRVTSAHQHTKNTPSTH